MIQRIQAVGYRGLRRVDVELDRFQALVGANASGKSTFLDIVGFVRDLVRSGLVFAVGERTDNLQDLVWGRPTEQLRFEIAVEVRLPESVLSQVVEGHRFERFRYELAVEEVEWSVGRIQFEAGILLPRDPGGANAAPVPDSRSAAGESVLRGTSCRPDERRVFVRPREGMATFESEGKRDHPRRVAPSSSPLVSALAVLPGEGCHPTAEYVRDFLLGNVRRLETRIENLRKPSRPARPTDVFSDENLPWRVKLLRDHDPDSFGAWFAHLKTVLLDLEDVRVVVRPEDRHAYVMLHQRDGVGVPSWALSDGTLRLLAHTLLAYRGNGVEADRPGAPVLFIEEPENGVHPLALDAIYDSLSSLYDAQVLVTTHSPAFLGLCRAEEVLCFGRSPDGMTRIVRGDEHPSLKNWQGAADMSVLLGTGVIE